MITIGTGIGIFTVDDGDLVTGNESIRAIYQEFVANEPLGPSDGEPDFALAKLLADTLGEGFDILYQDELKSEEVIY